MKDELIDLRNVDSGAKYVFETNKICGFGRRCFMIIQMLENKLSKSYFSSPVHVYVSLDPLPFCTWKQNIETDSTLLQKTILDTLFPQRSQEFTILSKTSHKSVV